MRLLLKILIARINILIEEIQELKLACRPLPEGSFIFSVDEIKDTMNYQTKKEKALQKRVKELETKLRLKT